MSNFEELRLFAEADVRDRSQQVHNGYEGVEGDADQPLLLCVAY